MMPAQAEEERSEVSCRNAQCDNLQRCSVHSREAGEGRQSEQRHRKEINNDEANEHDGERDEGGAVTKVRASGIRQGLSCG